MIMGMPGAGKSTLATRFAGYARLNRDELGGTLKGLAHKLDEVLATEPRVVLDNTYGVAQLARAGRADREASRRRRALRRARHAARRLRAQRGRADHRALRSPARSPAELVAEKQVAPNVLFRYRRQLEPPREDEGFTIEHVAFERAPLRGTHKAAIVELDHRVWTGRPRKTRRARRRARATDRALSQQRGYSHRRDDVAARAVRSVDRCAAVRRCSASRFRSRAARIRPDRRSAGVASRCPAWRCCSHTTTISISRRACTSVARRPIAGSRNAPACSSPSYITSPAASRRRRAARRTTAASPRTSESSR